MLLVFFVFFSIKRIPLKKKSRHLTGSALSLEEDGLHIGLTIHLHLLGLRAGRVLEMCKYFSQIVFFGGCCLYLDYTPHELVNLKSLKQGRFAEMFMFSYFLRVRLVSISFNQSD